MSIRKQRRWPALLLGGTLAISGGSFALAELAVIYDSGHTQPLAPLLDPLLANERASADPAQPREPNLSSHSMLGPAAISNLLPVRSPELTVGDSAERPLNPARLALGNPRPFFLIGSDARSLQWLATHRDMLKTLGAVGMLVQADTEADVRRVAEAGRGLAITLGAGSDLAAALGIHHYPVLITRDGILQ